MTELVLAKTQLGNLLPHIWTTTAQGNYDSARYSSASVIRYMFISIQD